MTAVAIAGKKVHAGEQAIPLIGGEVHYWRLNPRRWRDCLLRVKELGLSVVATYMCWEFHELEPGRYDFDGASDPRRNLVGFLDLLAELDLWVIARPGPYIYSEWRNGGVPDYAAPYHRLDPAFQALAWPWMQAVAEILRPRQATRGGRILLLQPDNEIDSWSHWYTELLGLGRQAGLFQTFLHEVYGGVARLNAEWGSHYASCDEARAVMEARPDQPEWMRRYLDYARFTHWYSEQVAQWNVRTYRELGLDVPMVLNTLAGVARQVGARLEQIADVAGPDLYPSHEFRQSSGEHRQFLEAVRYAQGYSRLPYIPEFECGVWHGWHYDSGALGPNHYRLMCLSALLAGAAGWNWYMLVNRDNWYMSPINEWGRTRPELFAALRQIVDTFVALDPARLVRLCDTAVTHDALQRATTRPGQDLLQALYDADVDYEFFDLDRGNGQDAKRLLFYAGGPWLSAAGQARLRDYVEAGGHLVCLGSYPRLDDRLHPLNLLDIVEPDGIVGGLGESGRLNLWLGAVQWTGTCPWLSNYGQVPGTAITVERLDSDTLTAEEFALHNRLPAGQRYCAGYHVPRGQGQFTVLGVPPSASLLLAVHEAFDVWPHARALTPAVSTGLFQAGTSLYLIAVNHGDEDKAAEIELSPRALGLSGGRCRVQDVLGGGEAEVDLRGGHRLTLALPRMDGRVLQLSPVA